MCQINIIHIHNSNNDLAIQDLKAEVYNYFNQRNRPLPSFRCLDISSIDEKCANKFAINLLYDDGFTLEQALELKKHQELDNVLIFSENSKIIQTLSSLNAKVVVSLSYEKSEIVEALERICSGIRAQKMVVISTEGTIILTTGELNYINIEGRSLAYHTDNKVYYSKCLRASFMKSIPEISNKPELYITATALIVNLSKIKKINGEQLTFMNGDYIYVPKSQINDLYNAWLDYHLQDE